MKRIVSLTRRAADWGTLCVVVWSLALAAPAAADRPIIERGRVLQDGMAIEIGLLAHGGASEFSSTVGGVGPNAQAVVLRDRNGLTSRVIFGLLLSLAGGMAAAGPKSVESKQYVSGNYLVTETKTTYYSEAEKEQIRQQTAESVEGLFSAKYSDFELQVFSRDRLGFGDASGYKLNMFVGGGKKVGFETGLGWGDVDSEFVADGGPVAIDHKYLGMPFRLSTAAGPFRMALTFEWNWLAHGLEDADREPQLGADGVTRYKVAYHPWHFDMQAALLGQLYVTGGVTAPKLSGGDGIGYRVGAGLRF